MCIRPYFLRLASPHNQIYIYIRTRVCKGGREGWKNKEYSWLDLNKDGNRPAECRADPDRHHRPVPNECW